MPVTQLPRTLTALVLVGSILALTACTGPDPSPPTSSSPPPVFANEEEALAAGREAYEGYLAVWNAIVLDGGVNEARVDEVTSGELRAFEHESLASLRELGWTFSGAVTLETFSMDEWYSTPDAAGVLVVGVACVDMTASQAVGPDGQSVIKPERPKKRAWKVHVTQGEAGQQPYVLSKHDVVEEGETCGN